jgi:hypothetical protein
MPTTPHEGANLLLFSEIAGAYFGTEELAILLHSLVRMQRPKTVVELGTGLAASAFGMALGLKRNGIGHIWTIDDFDLFDREPHLLPKLRRDLENAALGTFQFTTAAEYFGEISAFFGITDHLTVLRRRLSLEEPGQFDRMPFSGDRIDLLLSDFRHGPHDILRLLADFLPRMNDTASIFIDSASSSLASYLLLERLAAQFNAHRIPRSLQELCTVDLREVIQNKRFVLLHLTRQKCHDQNCTAWLKIEPDDLRPRLSARDAGDGLRRA